MQLLSLTLNGQYKGLKDQYFDFSQTQGNILALIGLNGSGKSQLLELIAETFAYLECWQRGDFQACRGVGFGVSLIYQCDISRHHDVYRYHDILISNNGVAIVKVDMDDNGCVQFAVKMKEYWQELPGEKELPIPFIIGYSSGLNENLQRSFIKNAVQYYEVMRIRKKRRKELTVQLDSQQISEVNLRYQKKYPHIFELPDEYWPDEGDQLLDVRESDTALSQLIYLDYDNIGLLLTSLAMLPQVEISGLLDEVTFKYPTKVTFHYNLRGDVAGRDAISDIQMLLRIAGEDYFRGVGKRTSDEEFDLYDLDYLEGMITLNLTDSMVTSALSEANYGDPVSLFRRLFKVQQLGVKSWWPYHTREKLLKGNFPDTVKKPLKAKLPLSVIELKLSDGSGREVNFDDLSDGEAQLIQILTASRIFSREDALFLLDEPETHLNPSWRTNFHRHISKALSQPGQSGIGQAQAFISTHSPFMISSLKKENVYVFKRENNGMIAMEPAPTETYGSSFDVLIKEFFNLRSLISQSVVDEIRKQLKQSDEHALQWIKANLGLSAERAYLIRKLSK